jgi:hypothetical protein
MTERQVTRIVCKHLMVAPEAFNWVVMLAFGSAILMCMMLHAKPENALMGAK